MDEQTENNPAGSPGKPHRLMRTAAQYVEFADMMANLSREAGSIVAMCKGTDATSRPLLAGILQAVWMGNALLSELLANQAAIEERPRADRLPNPTPFDVPVPPAVRPPERKFADGARVRSAGGNIGSVVSAVYGLMGTGSGWWCQIRTDDGVRLRIPETQLALDELGAS